MSFKLLMALLFAAVLSGCATPRTVVSHTYNFNNLKNIGISKFDNPKKISGIEDIFAQQLIKKGFKTVERNKLDRVLKEQKIAASGLEDPDTTKKLGQLLGVDGLLVGEVTYYSPKQSKTHTEEDDTYFSVPVYKKIDNRIQQTGTKTKVDKRRYPVTVTTNPQIGLVAKIIDVETAEIVWVGSFIEEGDNVMDAEEDCVHLLVKSLWKDIKKVEREKAKEQKQ